MRSTPGYSVTKQGLQPRAFWAYWGSPTELMVRAAVEATPPGWSFPASTWPRRLATSAVITIVVPPEVQEFIEEIFVELYNQRRYDGRIRLGLSHPMARGIDEARSWFLGAALLAGAKAVAKDALG